MSLSIQGATKGTLQVRGDVLVYFVFMQRKGSSVTYSMLRSNPPDDAWEEDILFDGVVLNPRDAKSGGGSVKGTSIFSGKVVVKSGSGGQPNR